MGQDRSTVNALLVLGMHRSGTSALTRVLSLLGAELPSHLLPPNPLDNETGFWEPAEIVQVHDELLGSVGSRWDHVVEFPQDWFGSPMAEQYADRLAELVHKNYQDSSFLVLKDPRLCQLVPLWVEVLKRLKIQPHFVIPIRNPLEVAASLKKRNGFSVSKSAMLWLRHALDSERNSRGYSRCFTSYDQLLNDWQQLTNRMASELGLQWPRASARSGIEIEAFLSDSLRHNRFRQSDLREHSQVIDWVKQAYAVLIQATRGDTSSLSSSLDRIRAKLQPAERAFGPILLEASMRQEQTENALRATQGHADALGRRQAELEAEAQQQAQQQKELEAGLRQQIADLVQQVEAARQGEQASKHRLAELESQFGAALAAETAERTRLEIELQVAQADRQLLFDGLAALDAFRERIDKELEISAEERSRLIAAQHYLQEELRRTEAEREAAKADRQAVWQVLHETVERSTAAHAALERQYLAALADRRHFEAELDRVAGSRSWKLTQPIRSAAGWVRHAPSARLARGPLAIARRWVRSPRPPGNSGSH